MATVTISLPAHLKEFVDAEVAARGYASAGQYLGVLVQKAHLDKHRARVEELLLEGLNSGTATPMTAQDWQDIRREIRQRLAKDKKKRKPERAEAASHQES